MKFLNPVLVSLFLTVIVGGCTGRSAKPDDNRLTATEEEIVIAHVRRFLKESPKIRLSQSERKQIQTVRPSFHVQYTGYKSGRLSIRWALPGYRVLLLQRSGNLLSSEKADWAVRIITDQTSGKIPPGFFGARGEDVSLPPK